MKNNNKIILFILSIIISFCFLFFSIPNFIENNKLENLLIRLNRYNNEEDFDSDGTINNNSSTNKNPNLNNNNPSDNNSTNQENNNPSNNGNNSNSNNNGDNSANPENNQNSGNTNSNNSTNENDKDNIDQNNDYNNGSNNNDKPTTPPIDTNPSLPTKKTYTIILEKNGANSIGASQVSCETSTSSCQVTLPSIYSDKDILGWSNNATSITAEHRPGDAITINSNQTLYAITKKTVSATIYGNGAYEGSKLASCTYYNLNNSCNVVLPTIPKDFYTIFGYTRNKNTDYIEYYENQTITLNQNVVLYTIRKIDSSNYDSYSATAKEIVNKINDLRKSRGLSTLNYSKSLELTAMLRISEISKNYNFNVNGDYHYRISNNKPFYTANEMAYGENFWRTTICDANTFHNTFINSEDHLNNMLQPNHSLVGISIGKINEHYYIVELFGTDE